MVDADERYFLIRVDTLAESACDWMQEERGFMTEYKWWTQADLAKSGEMICQETLAAMLVDA
jgi:hypothetical protein